MPSEIKGFVLCGWFIPDIARAHVMGLMSVGISMYHIPAGRRRANVALLFEVQLKNAEYYLVAFFSIFAVWLLFQEVLVNKTPDDK